APPRRSLGRSFSAWFDPGYAQRLSALRGGASVSADRLLPTTPRRDEGPAPKMTRTTPIGRARSVVVVLAATQLASVGVGQAWAATTGRWVPTKNLMSARHVEASAALLADGRVLVAGDQGVRGSADVYDPRTKSFTATADMSFPRALFTLTRLADGTVLAPGGFNDFNQIVLSSVELY